MHSRLTRRAHLHSITPPRRVLNGVLDSAPNAEMPGTRIRVVSPRTTDASPGSKLTPPAELTLRNYSQRATFALAAPHDHSATRTPGAGDAARQLRATRARTARQRATTALRRARPPEVSRQLSRYEIDLNRPPPPPCAGPQAQRVAPSSPRTRACSPLAAVRRRPGGALLRRRGCGEHPARRRAAPSLQPSLDGFSRRCLQLAASRRTLLSWREKPGMSRADDVGRRASGRLGAIERPICAGARPRRGSASSSRARTPTLRRTGRRRSSARAAAPPAPTHPVGGRSARPCGGWSARAVPLMAAQQVPSTPLRQRPIEPRIWLVARPRKRDQDRRPPGSTSRRSSALNRACRSDGLEQLLLELFSPSR